MDDPYSSRTLDFVVRIWLEERAHHELPLMWRGYVVQVMSGQKYYFQDLAGLQAFIEAHIAAWCAQDHNADYE